MSDAIKLVDVVKYYNTPGGTIKALDCINLSIPKGGVFGLLGPNGAGKSTALEIAVGLRKASSGTVSILGKDPQIDYKWIHERVGVQPQETVIFPQQRVGEIFSFWAQLYQDSYSPEQIATWLSLDDLFYRKIDKLSGGQRQRLNVGLALIGKPEIAILDEPSTGLDVVSREKLWETIRKLAKNGTTIVLSTHALDEAAIICDEIAVIDSGIVVGQGTPRRLIKDYTNGTLISFQVPVSLKSSVLDSLKNISETILVEDCKVKIQTNNLDLSLKALSNFNQIYDLHIAEPTLHEAYIKLTGHKFESTDSNLS